MKFLKEVWNRVYSTIKFIGETISKIVNFILLIILYFVGIGLTSIFTKLFKMKFLDLKKSNKKSYWKDNKITKKKIEEYYRTF